MSNLKNAPGNEDSHYTGNMQPIEYFLSAYPQALLANIIKYSIRHSKKGKLEDLQKAKWYVECCRRSLTCEKLGAGDFIASNECDGKGFDSEVKEIILDLELFDYIRNERYPDRSELDRLLNSVDSSIDELIGKYYG